MKGISYYLAIKTGLVIIHVFRVSLCFNQLPRVPLLFLSL